MTTGSAPDPADQVERGQGRGPGGDDVVDHRHPPAAQGRGPGRIQAELLGGTGGDGADRLGQRVAEVGLRGLVEDDVVVEAEVTG